MSVLSERIRSVVSRQSTVDGQQSTDKQRPTSTEYRVPSTEYQPEPAAAKPPNLSCLEGAWQDGCFVVEKRHDRLAQYGRERVESIARRLAEAGSEAAVMLRTGAAHPPFVFFDLETTGLAGGAGTQAFLVGVGRFDADGSFVTRQFVLVRSGDETTLLLAVCRELAEAGAIVSFNGKSFDLPLLEMRHLYHRLEWPLGERPHLDMLHPARRLWEGDDHSLGTLEAQRLGVRRYGDVPGYEIPSRYFQFVRTGDASVLAPVLEHNRFDLLSLAGVTARVLNLVRSGPTAAASAREALALGRIYGQAGRESLAHEAYERAEEMSRRTGGAVWIESVRSLALLLRRAHEHEAAAARWRQLVDSPTCPPQVAREASEALAIHLEHRVRDLRTAKTFALRSLTAENAAAGRRWNQSVEHRVARLDRKLVQQGREPAEGGDLEFDGES